MNLAKRFNETWAETSTVVLLLVGFLLSILLFSATLSYLTVILAGLLSGRIFYLKRFKEPIFPFILMILGFLFGYLLGGFWVSRWVVVIFFAIAFGVSHYLHTKKILVPFDGQGFIR